MDRDRLHELREHLDFVDDRFTHRVRPSSSASLVRPGIDELERRQRDLAEYTVELKETLRRLLELIEDGS